MHNGIPAALLLAAAAGAAHADYTTMNLTPAGSTNAVATSIDHGQVTGFAVLADTTHAWSWSLLPATNNDLQPADAGPDDSSQATGVSAATQVGQVIIGGLNEHAAMWTGTAASFTRLNETGYATRTSASAMNGGMVAGYGEPDLSGQLQAVVWTAPANPLTAPVGLPAPATYNASAASALGGNRVVGFATDTASGLNHAALWDISNLAAPVFTDIQPAGFTDSQALGTAGNQIAGYGDTTASGVAHAILWTVSPVDASVTSVDLNPAGYDASAAGATNGLAQVGYAVKDGHNDALLWTGSAGSFVDLSQFLPAGAYTDSEAFSIDSSGEISGLAEDAGGNTYAIVWLPVPEPATGALLGLGALVMLRRRR